MYSLKIFSCSRPVNLCKRKSKMACACGAVKKYSPSRIPNSSSTHSGRAASSPAAANMSETRPKSQPRANNCSFASLGVGEFLIRAIIGSIFDSAIDKPSSKCARSRALRNSKMVLRVTTSRRCKIKASIISRKLNSLG